MTLTEFLLARIAERESVARDVRHQALIGRPLLQLLGGGTGIRELVDPDRVLAECEAKRLLVTGLVDFMEGDYAPWNELFLRYMARPHYDHPDYDQQWSGDV